MKKKSKSTSTSSGTSRELHQLGQLLSHPDKEIDKQAIKVMKGLVKDSKSRCRAFIAEMNSMVKAERALQKSIEKMLARNASSRRKRR